jgi:hypothetical protein
MIPPVRRLQLALVLSYFNGIDRPDKDRTLAIPASAFVTEAAIGNW